MFAIVLDDGFQKFYFAGWEGSDVPLPIDEMSFWRPHYNDPETYEYDDIDEAGIEAVLLRKTDLNFAVGLPDDFNIRNTKLSVQKVRAFNHGH